MDGPVEITYPSGDEECRTGPTVRPMSAIADTQLSASDPDPVTGAITYTWQLNVRPEYAAIAQFVEGSPSNASASTWQCSGTPPPPDPGFGPGM